MMSSTKSSAELILLRIQTGIERIRTGMGLPTNVHWSRHRPLSAIHLEKYDAQWTLRMVWYKTLRRDEGSACSCQACQPVVTWGVHVHVKHINMLMYNGHPLNRF